MSILLPSMVDATSSEVSVKLRELAVAIRSAGDPKLAETLHKISNSRGRITSCREKILSTDPDLDPENWFKCWESKSGDKLSSKQAKRLAALIKRWSRRTGEDTQTLKEWISNPSTFWGMDPFRTPFEFVRHCLELAEKTEGKEPIRRRVTLVVLYDIISEEISRLRRQSNQLRHQKYLTSAVKNIVAKAYHSKNASERTKLHTRLTYLQRYGEKWSRLERREIVLAPLDNARDNFERIKIESIEIEALKAFEETRDDEYRKHLRLAFKSIYEACILQRNTVNASGLNLSFAVASHHCTSSISTAGHTSLKRSQKRCSTRPGSSEGMHALPARKRLKLVRKTEPRIGSARLPSHYPERAPGLSMRDPYSPASIILPLQGASSPPSCVLLSGDGFSTSSHNSPGNLARTLVRSQHQDSSGDNGRLNSQRMPSSSSDFPHYDPLEHLVQASAPFQLPDYNPLENHDQTSVPSQPAEDTTRDCLDQSSFSSLLPGYNPLESTNQGLFCSQLPDHNPFGNTAHASFSSQLPDYNPLDNFVQPSFPSHLPDYNPLDNSVQRSCPSQLPDHNPLGNPDQASASSQPAEDTTRDCLDQSSFSSLLPGYNPLESTNQALFCSQLPDYNPLDNFVQPSFPSQLPDYDPLDNRDQASAPSQLADYSSREHFVQSSVSQPFPDYNPLEKFVQSQVSSQYEPAEHLAQSSRSQLFPDYNLSHMHAAF